MQFIFHKCFVFYFLFCFSYSFLQHLFPPLLDVVGKLGGEDVANLLFVATECHVALDEFLAGAAVVGVVEDVGGIAAGGLLVGFPYAQCIVQCFGAFCFHAQQERLLIDGLYRHYIPEIIDVVNLANEPFHQRQ